MQAHIKPAATAIRERMAGHLFEVEKARGELKALQLLCTHDWIETGHDSHHRFFACPECGREDTDLTLPPRSHDRPSQA